jgi:predicted nucleotidyltransferase component of viral defense system
LILREEVERIAQWSGFRPDGVEKTLRLVRILGRLDTHPTTKDRWLLKGGTALNMLHLDVPRLSVDIDLDYVGAVDRDEMLEERPGFEAALASVCEREGCTIRRTPEEHAGGKFHMRFDSVFGGSQNLEVDVSYVSRVPLLGTERRITRFPPDGPVEVTTLPLKELAAGKFCALMHRAAPRDAFDAMLLLDQKPDLTEDPEFRLAFVCAMAGDREDPRTASPHGMALTERDVRQRLVPMLRVREDSSTDSVMLCERLSQSLSGIAARLLDWTDAERAFLDALQEDGVVDPEQLHRDREIRDRIAAQPMLRWKAENVRRHLAGGA